MKSLAQVLLTPHSSSEILMGNHAIVRAMLETQTQVVSAYPGSPTPEIADAIGSLQTAELRPYFEYSTNEKVATEVAFGASINGQLSCVFFKSVGLNVAADSFVQLAHLQLIAGMVIILGDDPGVNSSQNEQDNRHYARLSYTPILEPATPQEAYTYYKEAVRLSREFQIPVILRLTTHVCHAKSKVNFEALPTGKKPFSPLFSTKNGPYVPIGKDVFPLKRRALNKLIDIATQSNKSPLHREIYSHSNQNKRGIITAGLPALSAAEIINSELIPGETTPTLLKLAMIHPLPLEIIENFLRRHQEVRIIEELDDFLEQKIKALAFDKKIECKIIGKQDVEDYLGEYTPERMASLLRKTWPELFTPALTHSPESNLAPARPPQLCPGCGHRSAFFAIKTALATLPDSFSQPITVADIGCHTLGYLEPYKMGEVLLCMGHVCGTAAGLSLHNSTRPVIGFIGDSTFFHAGLPGIVNAVFNKHQFTLILMENGTTAMTGHQELPSTGKNFSDITTKIPVKQVLIGLGVTDITEIDAYKQAELSELVSQAVQRPGFKVIIAKHPCMLKFTNQLRRKAKPLPRAVTVNASCTSKDLEKTRQFACPAYQRTADGKLYVEKDLCIGDRSCTQTAAPGVIE